MMKKTKKHNEGYSLVELIIVIAVITVLTTAAIATVATMRSAKAKEASVIFGSELSRIKGLASGQACDLNLDGTLDADDKLCNFAILIYGAGNSMRNTRIQMSREPIFHHI